MAIWDWRRKSLRPTPPTGVPRPPETNRRAAERFPCRLKASIRPVALLVTTPLPAQVRDISCRGIGLVCGIPLSPGTFIVVTLQKGNSRVELQIPAQVVRAVPAEANRWLVGCAFRNELAPEELRTLLA